MDLELLRTFLELSRTRHFGQAAGALNVTQAAVSARIKHLESILGVQLFDRKPRDVRLTPEGNRLIRHADLLIAEWRKARQEVTAGGAKSQLSIGGSARLWDVMLQDWIIRMRRDMPSVALITHSQAPEQLIRLLLDGVLDLAVMLDPPQLETLRTKEIAVLKLVLVADRPGLPAARAVTEGFVFVDWGLAHTLELRQAFPDMPEPHTRFANSRLAMNYLREIGGAAYLPLPLVRSALRRGRLHRVPGAEVFVRDVYAAFPVRSDREELIDRTLKLFPRSG